jgi:hypothetical protein
MVRPSDYRFWLVFAALAVAVIAACGSDTTGGGNPTGGGDNSGSTADMTQG